MKRKTMARNALFTSIISLLLCVSMLVGTTFAWFTDSVSSANNIIQSGNLDIDVKMGDGNSIQGVDCLFKDVDLWEPGAVAFENLTVENNGSLALKYQMALNFTNASTNNAGGTLADVLKVAIIPGGFNGNREQAKALAFNYSLSSFSLNGKLLPDQEEVFGIVIYWQPSAIDNQYNLPGGMTIDLGVLVNATQLTSEDDSFGPDYDVNTTFPGQAESETSAANVKANGAATVEVNAAPAAATNKTVIDAPEGSFNPTDKVEVTVKPSNSLFNVTNVGNGEVVASLDVIMTVNGSATSADLPDGKLYTVTTYISKGLKDVEVSYTGDDGKTQPTGFDYDPVTGKLVFTTSHFSNYAVIAKALAYDLVNDTGVTDLKAIVDSFQEEGSSVIVPAKNQEQLKTEIQNSTILTDEEKAAALEAMNTVAKIGTASYQTLAAAFEAVQNDETITLQKDITSADGILIANKNITVDLNGKTYTVSDGSNVNSRAFKINGSSVVTIKNGTIVAQGTKEAGAYGTVRTEGSAKVILEKLKLYNYRGGGLNIKAVTGTNVTINNCEIYSQYGGGVEAAGGKIVLNNTKIDQQGVYSNGWYSVAMEINGGGVITVNSGEYSGKAIATDANAAMGNCVAFILSSGGTLDIKGGTFNGVVAETANASNFCGLIYADRAAVVNIHGGTFNSNGAILDMRNNEGRLPNPTATIYGGSFSADPRVSGLYSSNLISVAEGYEVKNVDGTYIVAKNDLGLITTEAQLLAGIAKGGKLKLDADIELTSTVVIPEGVTVALEMNEHRIATVEESAGKHHYAFENKGTLTLSGKGGILSRGINNYGKLILDGADIVCVDTKGDQNGEYAVRNYAGSEFTMESGKLRVNKNESGISQGEREAGCLRVEEGACATLKGGIIWNRNTIGSESIDNAGIMVIDNITVDSVSSCVANLGILTVNGGSFKCSGVSETSPTAVIFAPAGTTTVNGGRFAGPNPNPGFIVKANSGAEVLIKGGDFLQVNNFASHAQGTIIVSGGTFPVVVPQSNIAEGYYLSDNNGTYTVLRVQ